MTSIKRLCVYCGSSAGHDPALIEATRSFGRQLAQAGIGLVYGGGSHGLMGHLARAVLEAGGHVTGIIPDFLVAREKMLEEAQTLHVVADMHTRKQMMFDHSDAFVALPGGIGTLEELVEQLTWVQLQRHAKPVIIADLGGFWAPLLALFDHMRQQGFIRPAMDLRYHVARHVEDILPILAQTAPSGTTKGHHITLDAQL
jgi:uncharacterized protein (TIGR00730 family)